MVAQEHPSNVLARGECRTFPDALAAYRRACQCERSYAVRNRISTIPGLEDTDTFWDAAIGEADQARLIYNDALRQAEAEAARRLREKSTSPGDAWDLFAEAIETGDYSRLAI